jgi:hypothetical protein
MYWGEYFEAKTEKVIETWRKNLHNEELYK